MLRALRDAVGPGPGAPADPSASIDVFGTGGPALQAAGLRTVVDARELLSMGFSEILGKLPRILRALNELEAAAIREKPDFAVVIDYPDFHFRLAKRLKRLGIPVYYFIPPKVWVWRRKRVKTLKENFQGVLTIFPFEKEFFASEGLEVEYVGNPLLDELPLEVTKAEARERLGIDPATKVIALLPGSRPSELKRHLELFLDAGVRASALLRSRGALGDKETLLLRIALPETADLAAIESRLAAWKSGGGWNLDSSIVRVEVRQGDSAMVLRAADAGIVKSGTSTLEAALMDCPHVVAYRPGVLSSFIFKNFIRYDDPVGLVNLILRERGRPIRVAPEILMEEATSPRLAEEVVRFFMEPAVAAKQRSGFRAIRAKLEEGLHGKSPSQTAANLLLSWSRKGEK